MAVVFKDKESLRQEKKLAEDLRKAQRVVNRKFREELKRWWRKVKDTAYQLCPKDTGTLAKTIRVRRIQECSEHIGLEAEKAIVVLDTMIVAGGMLVNPKTGRICDYATYVHDGHRTPSGGFVPPRPFLTDAIAKHLPELRKILDEIFKGVK